MPKENYFEQPGQGELFDKAYEEKLEEKPDIFSEEEIESAGELVDSLEKEKQDRKRQEFFEKLEEDKEDHLSYLRGRRDLK